MREEDIFIAIGPQTIKANRYVGIPGKGFIAGDTTEGKAYFFIQFTSGDDFTKTVESVKDHIKSVLR